MAATIVNGPGPWRIPGEQLTGALHVVHLALPHVARQTLSHRNNFFLFFFFFLLFFSVWVFFFCFSEVFILFLGFLLFNLGPYRSTCVLHPIGAEVPLGKHMSAPAGSTIVLHPCGSTFQFTWDRCQYVQISQVSVG